MTFKTESTRKWKSPLAAASCNIRVFGFMKNFQVKFLQNSWNTLQLALTFRKLVTFFFYSWGMRTQSFNLGFIWLWTEESFLTMASSTDKANTFHIFPGCCCKSSENHIPGSNFSKIQFLGSKPKGRKAKRNPSTSQTLRTPERVHVVFDSLVTYINGDFQLSGTLKSFMFARF